MVIAGVAAGWPTDHTDNLRSGNGTTAAPFSSLRSAFSVKLDGAVYGAPILAGTNIVVATENNTVYALDPATGAIRWSHHLRTPISDTSVLACPGNIDPTGITGTPAYDASTGRIFVVTITNSPTLGVEHEIFGLRATDGSTVMNRRVEVPGTDPKAQQQRAALATANGHVYIAFGGLIGDCGHYRGALISLRTDGQLGGIAYVVPTAREGAIWAAGGPVVAPDGNIYVAVGNGAATSGSYDYSDSVTRLNPAMKRIDYFAPSDWASDNAGDKDLGSMTPAYTTAGFILQAGKSGNGYTLRTDHLGGIGGQVYTAPLCRAFGVSAVTGPTVYLPCTDGVTRVDVTPSGRFVKKWTASGIMGSPVAGPGALYAVGGNSLDAICGGSGKVLGSVAIGATSRFATPTLVGNKAYVGTLAGISAVTIG